MPLPEATELLGLEEIGADDMIGGNVVPPLRRITVEGDRIPLGGYRVTVIEVEKRRITKLCFERKSVENSAASGFFGGS